MKNILKWILLFIIISILTYISYSFVENSFDITSWSKDIRKSCIETSLTITILISIFNSFIN